MDRYIIRQEVNSLNNSTHWEDIATFTSKKEAMEAFAIVISEANNLNIEVVLIWVHEEILI